MNEHRLAWLAWSLWALFVALAAGLVLLGFLNQPSTGMVNAVTAALISTFPTVGALVAARRPRNPIGWLMLAIPLSFVSATFAYAYAFYTLIVAPAALPGGRAMAWLSTWVGFPGSVLLLTGFFLLFPTGHLSSPRWRPMLWLASSVLIVGSLAKAFTPGNVLSANSPIPNPLGLESAATFLQWLNGIIQISGIPIAVLCGGSTILRFRQARGDERQQLKWFAYAIFITVVFFVINFAAKLSPALKPALPDALLNLVFGLVVSLPALAIGIAILKYRLYAIDLIIRRTLIYSLLTAVLTGVYLVAVILLQAIFRALTGQGSTLAVVISTLIIAALFVPLRNRLQSAIDRRFYRHKYDAARTLAEFGASVRDEVDLEKLTGRLVSVVDDTMEPESVGLWLKSSNKWIDQAK